MKNSKFYLAIKLYRQNIYTSREIAIGLNLDHSVVKKWIQADYQYRLLNNKIATDRLLDVKPDRQEGFSSWVSTILHREVSKKRKKKLEKIRVKKVS